MSKLSTDLSVARVVLRVDVLVLSEGHGADSVSVLEVERGRLHGVVGVVHLAAVRVATCWHRAAAQTCNSDGVSVCVGFTKCGSSWRDVTSSCKPKRKRLNNCTIQ